RPPLRHHGTESPSRFHQQDSGAVDGPRVHLLSRERRVFSGRACARDRESGALAKASGCYEGRKIHALDLWRKRGRAPNQCRRRRRLEKLTDMAPKLHVIHQTGQADFAVTKEAYDSLPFEAEVTPFIDKMDEAYARADLVLCRAGATTVAELTAFGKAAILVPYPYAIYDHQRWNAQALQDRGAAEMILDRELSGETLAAWI